MWSQPASATWLRMSDPRGAHAGTEYRPQWMKMPSLASWYQSGTSCVASDSYEGASVIRAGPLRQVPGTPARHSRMVCVPSAHDIVPPGVTEALTSGPIELEGGVVTIRDVARHAGVSPI